MPEVSILTPLTLPEKFDTGQNPKNYWPWGQTRVLRTHWVNVGANVEATLRDTLPEGLYWAKLSNSRLIVWNLRLVRSYVALAGTPDHQRLVERYLASLK
jgi:hypothetical protein